MNALSAGAVLETRYASLKQKQLNDDVSIENKVSNTTNNTSIELPDEIKALITGNDYWVTAKTNRYKKLILHKTQRGSQESGARRAAARYHSQQIHLQNDLERRECRAVGCHRRGNAT
jgi:hypothetical protein